MKFELSGYFAHCFVKPIFGIFIVFLFAIALVIGFCQSHKWKIEIEKLIISCIIFGCFVAMSLPGEIRSLTNGGIYLCSEKEDDAISLTGTIELIETPSKKYPDIKDNHRYGADITIDGDTYTAIESGGFKEGDVVTITCLPKSKVILSIYIADLNATDN